jgi:hypothetical protein
VIRRIGQLARRTLRVIRDRSLRTLPVALVLAASVSILVLQVAPQSAVSAKLMVAAPRYAKELEATIVNVDAVEVGRYVFRELTEVASLRRAAFHADLVPSAFAPGLNAAIAKVRPAVKASTATDKDKVTVITLDVQWGDPGRALALAEGLAEAAVTLDLQMRESILAELAGHLERDQRDVADELATLPSVAISDDVVGLTVELAKALRAERTALESALQRMLRNDPEAVTLRADIAEINQKLRAVSLVEATSGERSSMSDELAEAQAMVTAWEAEAARLRATREATQRQRDGLTTRLSDIEGQLAIVRSAFGLERMESNRRVSLMAPPSLKSARLPPPDLMAVVAALTIGLIAWLGGALIIEAASPKLRSADDLVSSFNIAPLSVIPELAEPLRKRVRRGPDRGPVMDDTLMFVSGGRRI